MRPFDHRSDRLDDIARSNPMLHESSEPNPRVVVRMATRAADADVQDDGPPSLWLYLGGLCVTLSGLYAVNFGQEDTTFALTTYALAVAGYVSSYLLRLMRVPYHSLRLPALVLIGLGLFAWLTSGRGDGVGEGQTILQDRSQAMQVLCLWIALLHTFAVVTDASVLFSCVPCMSLVALVSSTRTDSEVQYAFLVFVAAATFLMIHENFLRTRRAVAQGYSTEQDRKLFVGQLLLAVGCVACAFVLANPVAIPMQGFGQSLLLSNNLSQLNNSAIRPPPGLTNIFSNDRETMIIGGGPQTESSQPVMRVNAPRAQNWRGTTYDFYTGISFQNQLNSIPQRLQPVGEAQQLQQLEQFQPVKSQNAGDMVTFRVPQSQVEPDPSTLKGAQTFSQTVTLLSPGSFQCYGAGNPLLVSVPGDQALESTPAGTILTRLSFPANMQYRVISLVPTQDEATLRAASSISEDIPPRISDRYLQLTTFGHQPNDQLRQIAIRIVTGLSNNYDKAVAIRDYISRTCKYNLQTPAAPAASDRVEHFLTVSHEGYCDSFAAAMTMLCRYAGIPARVASGYISGDPDPAGGFLVLQKHKHAWSEVFFSGIGWYAFDATEGAQDISNHAPTARNKRTGFMAWLTSHGWLPLLAILVLAGSAIYLFIAEVLPRLQWSHAAKTEEPRPATNRAVTKAYLEACEYLARRGIHRPRSATPEEFLAAVTPTLETVTPTTAAALASLTALHDRFRYGREVAAESEAQEAAGLAVAIRSAIGSIPRKALMSAQILG